MTRPSAAPVDAEIPVVRSIRRALSSRENAGGGREEEEEEEDDDDGVSSSW